MDYSKIKEDLKQGFRGEVADDEETIQKYSHDASLFEVRPKLVLFPQDSGDVKKAVSFVSSHKKENPELSLTGRSAGSDMSGGALNESMILDFTTHFKKESVDLDSMTAEVEPGVFYREFEEETLPKHVSLPVYPASKMLAALGGMIMNNAAGEKTLRYGQMRDFVLETSAVLSDGNEYKFKELSRKEMEEKMAQNNFEGEIYKKVYNLVTENDAFISESQPKTSKNSAGYAVWRVWNKEKDTFDLGQLLVGSQGTLGLLTNAKVRLVKNSPERKLVAIFFKSWDDLPQVVNALLPLGPESLEAFDDATLKLALRFMPEIAEKAHENVFSFALKFLPEAFIGVEMLGLPKLIVLAEFAEDEASEIDRKVKETERLLGQFPVHYRVLNDEQEAEKYWIMRRESFSLLRHHVSGKRTAPFIDDFAVDPNKMPEFLPKLLNILKENDIKANIAGHAGNGNYHIIPLMDLTQESERAKIVPVSKKVYDLIVQYGGTITAEHNDGIIRTPFIEQMFGSKMYGIFKEVKNIFDPENIFNPGKKVGGSLEYLESHIVKE